MNRSTFLLSVILLTSYQCTEPPQDIQRQLMEDIFTDLNLYCGSDYAVNFDADVVKFLSCKEPSPSNEGEFILKGTPISYTISVKAFKEDPVTNCIEEDTIFSNLETEGLVGPLNNEIVVPDYQECINLIQRENQVINCLFNKNFVSDFDGVNSSFTLIKIENIKKL